MTPVASSPEVIPARFPVNIALPDAPSLLVKDAADAVRQEYRNSIRWKKLRCRSVAPLATKVGEAIFVIEVGHSIQFDWTWEGAVAFRPSDLSGFRGDIDVTDDFLMGTGNDTEGTSPTAWAGEVVEVDETNGRIFVSVPSPDHTPQTGTFFVRPFEFLTFLNAVYSEDEYSALRSRLAARLEACRGNLHPRAARNFSGGLPELATLWEHSWGLLWGPPGTGKTYTIGKQVAACLSDASERILVVSTTNRATDAAALSIGKAAQHLGNEQLLRIGKSASYRLYKENGLTAMLRGTETELLHQITELTHQLQRSQSHEDRAMLRSRIQQLVRSMKDSAFNIFVSPSVRVVIGTAFKALTLATDPTVRSILAQGEAPFTTVIIDEAGLISRATAAVLSLLASRRVLFVGDPKQLAPISRISRVLPTSQATWLASSSLSHLLHVTQAGKAVHLLREQHRMHPEVSKVVSQYQYDGSLQDNVLVTSHRYEMPPLFADQPRALWYVLDEDGDELPSIRAERGPGNRSWVRPKTRGILKKIFADDAVRKANGLFLSPFKAQAKDIARFFAAEQLDNWSASTIHSQQGTEADCVILDTVNAGSCGWPYDEWKRLINVGLSRAREFVMVLASRAEMTEPYMKPLLQTLAPRVLGKSGRKVAWIEVPVKRSFEVPQAIASNPDLLGSQLAQRKALRPVMSAEQQWLCGLNLDGKPRLVRGVAGSGKTVVLAHWLQKTVKKLAHNPDARVWAVFANRSLKQLITETIEDAWQTEGGGSQFPWERVSLCHIKDLLDTLLPEVGLRLIDFDYDSAAVRYLERRPFENVKPRCHAMFIDEAQDMGPSTLKLLSALVERTDPDDPKSRSINIFYDNAQNVYGRGTPKWSEIGLDLRGRSTVMKESFRSTVPITEFALNVLYKLQPPGSEPDHKELIDRGLIERSQRGGVEWWHVRFNQVDGPLPLFNKYVSLDQQVAAIAKQVFHWINDDGVRPRDICILANDKYHGQRIADEASERLNKIGAKAVYQAGQAFDPDDRSVIVSTTQSFKGYDAEVVVIGGVERFIGQGKILANNLYVAMTRARSILAVFAYAKKNACEEAKTILNVIEQSLDQFVERPVVEKEISNLDEFEEVLQRTGTEHRAWLEKIWKNHWIEQEPILSPDGEILAEPLFWFKEDERIIACFGDEMPGNFVRRKLEDAGIEIAIPGEPR